MTHILKIPLKSEADLLARCQAIEGLSFAQLASIVEVDIPQQSTQRKGFIGQVVELALGATAGNNATPDFCGLGIELKTIPLNRLGKSAESTFVTSIPLLTIHRQNWQTSQCYAKLKRVLWLPIEGSIDIPFYQRRIGKGFLWSPSMVEERILANDWNELTTLICMGRLNEINSSMGEYLQIRPKAACGNSLCYGFNEAGDKVLTLPRGFYLRARFTSEILGNINRSSGDVNFLSKGY